METTTAAPATVDFAVLLANKSRVEETLVTLAKRAARKGLPVLSWAWGKAYESKEIRHYKDGMKPSGPARRMVGSDIVGAEAYEVTIARIPLTLPAAPVRFAGWTFLASLEHLDGENIVRAVPGQECPVMYRTRGAQCDHCKTARRRHDTYVVRHTDGRTVQVGSTCIADFLGSNDATKLAAQASFLAAVVSAVEGLSDDEGAGGFGGHARADALLPEYLAFVAWEVRTQGWVSRTQAREIYCDTMKSTADRAWNLMTNDRARKNMGYEECPEDAALAEAAAVWAESLTDDQVNAGSGDYLHNVRVIARSGLASSRTAGIAASIVTAYQRAIGRARQAEERAARPSLNEYAPTPIGKRETFTLTLDFVTGYESQYGYTTVLKFKDEQGRTYVWKASSTDLGRSDVGKRFAVKGTVKAHSEYKGEKQTMLSRCSVTELASKSAA